MGIKDELKKTIDNVSDTFSEAGPRANAEAERANRDVAGGVMTPGEKVGSIANEGKESVLADVDRTKRDFRNDT
jgi:hypothetical protein